MGTFSGAWNQPLGQPRALPTPAPEPEAAGCRITSAWGSTSPRSPAGQEERGPAAADLAQVPEAFQEVTVYATEEQWALRDPAPRALVGDLTPKNDTTILTAGLPIYKPDLLARLEQGEEAWVPDIQSSEESADEERVKPILKQWLRKGKRWDYYKGPVSSSTSSSIHSGDGTVSENEEGPQAEDPEVLSGRSERNVSLARGSQARPERQQGNHPEKRWVQSTHNREGHKILNIKIQQGIQMGQRKHVCIECEKSFCSSSSLLRHQKTHRGERPYRCPDCGKGFSSNSSLIIHRRMHTGERPYQCPDCEKAFIANKSLTKHRKIHSGKRAYKCTDCMKTFITSDSLKKHQKKHMAVKPRQYLERGKGYTVHSALVIHQGTHMEQRAHVCPNCGRSFQDSRTLVRHQRIHTGEKPYKCFECGKCFRASSTLTIHQRLHTGEKPYKCLECGKGFRSSTGLTKHRRTHTRKKSSKGPQSG